MPSEPLHTALEARERQGYQLLPGAALCPLRQRAAAPGACLDKLTSLHAAPAGAALLWPLPLPPPASPPLPHWWSLAPEQYHCCPLPQTGRRPAMEVPSRGQMTSMPLHRAFSAPAAPFDAPLCMPPPLIAVAPSTSAAAGVPVQQANPVLTLLLQGRALQLQQQQQQLAQQLALAQPLRPPPGQQPAPLPPCSSMRPLQATHPSAAASALTALAQSQLPVDQLQPCDSFGDHWQQLDAAWREARQADHEAWQRLRAAQVGAAGRVGGSALWAAAHPPRVLCPLQGIRT